MTSKESKNNFNVNIIFCTKQEQENFNKVRKVAKLMEEYPNMSLTSAISHCNTTFPTYQKYKDIINKLKIAELI